MRLALLAVAVVTGVVGLAVAHGSGRFTTDAGRTSSSLVLLGGVAAALLAAGAALAVVRWAPPRPELALIAAALWSATPVVAAVSGGAWLPSAAAVAGPFLFPVVVHLVLGDPSVHARPAWPRAARAATVVVYGEAAIAATLVAAVDDPYLDERCLANCAVNSFLVQPEPAVAHGVAVLHLWFVAALGGVVVAVCIRRLLALSASSLRRQAVVVVPGAAYAATVATRAILLLRGPGVDDPYDASLFDSWVAQAVALGSLSLGLLAQAVRAVARQRALARIVSDLGEAPAPGALESALAAAAGDPELRVAYPLGGTTSWVDAAGCPVRDPDPGPGRSLTTLTRGGRTVALVSHRGPGEAIEAQLGPAIRLGLANARLQAEVLGRIREVRESQVRIVETGDAERRRLERDLHDGAQQRLLALSYDVRLALASARSGGDETAAAALGSAVEGTAAALADLRDIARGIFPATLTDIGLLPTLESFIDLAPLAIDLRCDGLGRLPTAVETAAYVAVVHVIDEAARRDARTAVLSAAVADRCLVVTIVDDGAERGSDRGVVNSSELVGVRDRVGALGGMVAVDARCCELVIPCA